MNKIILIISSLLFISSCNQNSIYTNYFDFNEEIWNSDSSIVFSFNSRDAENIRLNLGISYSNDYPFQNLYTSYSLVDSSNSILENKMIEYQLFDRKYGFPLGDGIFKNFIVDSLIIDSISINKNSEYKFIITQSMRDDVLKGISRVSLDINLN